MAQCWQSHRKHTSHGRTGALRRRNDGWQAAAEEGARGGGRPETTGQWDGVGHCVVWAAARDRSRERGHRATDKEAGEDMDIGWSRSRSTGGYGARACPAKPRPWRGVRDGGQSGRARAVWSKLTSANKQKHMHTENDK